ncbi:hypothetical protein ACHAP7_010893 [Fusarium lateritium]
MSSLTRILLLLCTFLPSASSQDSRPGGQVHNGQPKNCDAWHTVKEGDDCDSVPNEYSISRKQFLAWNPAISEDCTSNFWLEWAYCVSVFEPSSAGNSITSTFAISKSTTNNDATKDSSVSLLSSTDASSQTTSACVSASTESVSTTYSVRHSVSTWNITTPTADFSWPPKATQAGQPKECNKWHLVEGTQDCDTVLNKYSAFMREKDFFKWNPAVHEDCSGLFVGYWVCVGVKSKAAPNLAWSTSTPPFTPPPDATPYTAVTLTPADSDFTPSPTQGPLPTDCQNFHKVEADETCRDILKIYNYLSEKQFFKYNPVLKKDCNGLWKDNWYCVGISAELPAPPTVSTTPASVPTDSPKDCRSWYYTTGGETCDLLVKLFGTFDQKEFVAMNPSVREDCDGIQDETWCCVARPNTPTTRTAPLLVPSEPATAMPTQSGTSTSCKRYWLVSDNDTCRSVERVNGIAHEDFLAWNKALGSGCFGLKSDYYVCVAVK